MIAVTGPLNGEYLVDLTGEVASAFVAYQAAAIEFERACAAGESPSMIDALGAENRAIDLLRARISIDVRHTALGVAE